MNEFFANASVSAFVGAFSAFFLVILTDRRRLYRKRSVLRNVISDNRDHAQLTLDSVQRNLEMFKSGQTNPAPIMQFPTETIRVLQLEVIDILDANKNQAITCLLYWMTAINALLAEAFSKAEAIAALERRDPESDEKHRIYEEYEDLLEASEKNLNYLITLVGHYVSGRPERVLEFTHE